MRPKFTICARIYQFRSVQDSGWFPLQSMTCLVGKNGYGKTTILDALLAITTPSQNNVEDVYHYSDRRKSVIAELAVPVIDPVSQKGLGVLRVQRLRDRKCRYLFAGHTVGAAKDTGANQKDVNIEGNDTSAASQDSSFPAGDYSWMDDLYLYCKETADDHEPTDAWREVGFSEDDVASLQRMGSFWKPYSGAPEKLVLRAAESGLRGVDGKILFESAWLLVPRIISIPGRTACGDSASRKGLDLAGYEAMDHLLQVAVDLSRNPDPERILRAFICGCLAEDAAAGASSDNGSLNGLPNSSLGHLHLGKMNNSLKLNQIIERFWDLEFQINIAEKSDRFEVKFQKGKDHPMWPSELSKGTKWFFGFLSLAISARRDSICQATLWSEGKPHMQERGRLSSILDALRRKVRPAKKTQKPLFKSPVLFLLDEPATFMHLELQAKWLELMELFTNRHDDASLQYPLLTWLAPWFCFATHAPSLVRCDTDLVLAVDRLHELEVSPDNARGKYRQTASTIIRCPKAYDSNVDRYQKVVACFLQAHSDSVCRVFLEGQSDRFLLQFAIKGVINDGRPFYDPIPVQGVADPDKVWNIFWRNYLSDPDWMASTRKIIVIFDADPEGLKARAFIEKKWQEEKRDGDQRLNKESDKFVFSSVRDITGIENAVSEDLVPWNVVKEFCKRKLADANAATLGYAKLANPLGAKEAFKLLEEASNRRASSLKNEFIDYLRTRTPEECYSGDDDFKQRVAGKIRHLFR